jgi:hypothetical protein
MTRRFALLLIPFAFFSAGCDLGATRSSSTASALSGRVASGSPTYSGNPSSPGQAAAAATAPDDHANDAGRATPLTAGQPQDGRLESPVDSDWFAVDLVGGQRYELALACYGQAHVALIAPDGTTAAEGGSTSLVTHTPNADGTYYLRVEATAGRDLFYSLDVIPTH